VIEHDIQGVWGWSHTIFCDDLTLVAQRETGIQTLLDHHNEECKDPQIKYRGCPLRVVDDEEDVRHLGFWSTPKGGWKSMVDRVHVSTLQTINIVKHSVKVVSPSTEVNLFNSLSVSVFRYSVTLILWARDDLEVDTFPTQLDKLGHLWCQGFSSAWVLPTGTVHDLFTFPSEQGGMGYLQPVVHYLG